MDTDAITGRLHERFRPASAGRRAAALLIAAALLGSCSKRESDSARETEPSGAKETAAGVDACALVTKAELEPLLGSPIGKPETSTSTYPWHKSSCSYGGPRGAVMVMVEYPRPSRATTSAAFANELKADVEKNKASSPGFASTFGDVTVQPLEGLGVPAAWYDMRKGAQVWVDAVKTSGGTGYYLRVEVMGAREPVSLDGAKLVAQRAVSRLP